MEHVESWGVSTGWGQVPEEGEAREGACCGSGGKMGPVSFAQESERCLEGSGVQKALSERE